MLFKRRTFGLSLPLTKIAMTFSHTFFSSRQVLRAVLVGVSLCSAALTSAQAQNAIKSVTGGVQGGVEVIRIETNQPLAAPPTGFTIPVREVNWLGDAPFDSAAEWHVNVKVRSTRPPRPAVIRPLSATEAEVELLDPEDGVSAGQACVFYAPEGSRILGGGWIWRGR